MWGLQTVLTKAGGHDRKIVFLLNDTQIKEEAFLEDVDSLLNSGEVVRVWGCCWGECKGCGIFLTTFHALCCCACCVH